MWEDPIVAEVRRLREVLAARFNFEVNAIMADIRQRQTGWGDRLVTRKKRTEAEDGVDREPGSTSAADTDSTSATFGN
jgi:hypothetical protein